MIVNLLNGYKKYVFLLGMLCVVTSTSQKISAYNISHRCDSKLDKVNVYVFESQQKFKDMLRRMNFREDAIDALVNAGYVAAFYNSYFLGLWGFVGAVFFDALVQAVRKLKFQPLKREIMYDYMVGRKEGLLKGTTWSNNYSGKQTDLYVVFTDPNAKDPDGGRSEAVIWQSYVGPNKSYGFKAQEMTVQQATPEAVKDQNVDPKSVNEVAMAGYGCPTAYFTPITQIKQAWYGYADDADDPKRSPDKWRDVTSTVRSKIAKEQFKMKVGSDEMNAFFGGDPAPGDSKVFKAIWFDGKKVNYGWWSNGKTAELNTYDDLFQAWYGLPYEWRDVTDKLKSVTRSRYDMNYVTYMPDPNGNTFYHSREKHWMNNALGFSYTGKNGQVYSGLDPAHGKPKVLRVTYVVNPVINACEYFYYPHPKAYIDTTRSKEWTKDFKEDYQGADQEMAHFGSYDCTDQVTN